jgi:hypothetical protein
VGGGGASATVMVFWADVEPCAFVAVNVAVYVPLAVYVCVGFWLVDVPPSPNVHAQLVGPPVLVSVNVTSNCAGPLVGLAVKDAVGWVGADDTLIVCETDVPPPEFVAVSVAVNVPAVVYVCVGFWLVDVPPSPNAHAQLVGPPVLVSVKLTNSEAVPLVGLAVNAAVGAGVLFGPETSNTNTAWFIGSDDDRES